MDKAKLLVIEDSSITQRTLDGLFSQLGYEVKIFELAEEAKKFLEEGYMPDVIILDFKLPGKVMGPEFLKTS